MNDKLSIRPQIKINSNISDQSEFEQFQNSVLRPILKLQHDLIIAFFERYTKKKKINFHELSRIKKQELISRIFIKDHQFKTEFRGLILGQFTEGEFRDYQLMDSEVNRRIYSMGKERLLSTI
ncbi:glyoxalase [Lutimonas sp.]|uniref:glyoxalase n=1 Tax=Lutimonas sp. TaxID=1872403 RepID=UPI003D9B852B